ncbi:MAG: stage 0 sporulation protein [Clostridiales bacterium]|nr:stage 0 sporulation protein [Clostridiales bacterium]
MQVKEVKVCFVPNGKQYSFDCTNAFVKYGEKVVVETARGLEIGIICSKVTTCEDTDFPVPLKKVLRLATERDLETKENSAKLQQEIKTACEGLVKDLKLEMKITNVEVTLDSSKVLIYFTADNRVDFRELIKMLANQYKMRIELKQIDAREETKLMGGLGPCGRECCCACFLSEAEHSSIKMAKMQGLSLNPSSISGLCGKLKCCLAYENAHYTETFKLMPPVNSEVITPDGKGLVVYNNLLKRIVSVKLTSTDGLSNIKEYELSQLKNLEGKPYVQQ